MRFYTLDSLLPGGSGDIQSSTMHLIHSFEYYWIIAWQLMRWILLHAGLFTHLVEKNRRMFKTSRGATTAHIFNHFPVLNIPMLMFSFKIGTSEVSMKISTWRIRCSIWTGDFLCQHIQEPLCPEDQRKYETIIDGIDWQISYLHIR